MVYYKGKRYTGVRRAGPCPAGFTKGQYGCRPIRGMQKTRPREVDESSRSRLRETRSISERATVGSSSWLTNVIAAAVAAATLGATYYGTQKWPQETAKRFKPKIPKGAMVAVPRSPVAPKGTGKYSYRPRYGGRTFGTPKIRSAAKRAYTGKRY